MANLSSAALLSQAKYAELAEMYGDNPADWRLAGAATLIGADIADGYAKWATNSLRASQIEKRQSEINSRADITIANLLEQGEQVADKQEAAFIKAGVKIEGSALSVMSETLENANQAAMIRRREADFELGQMEVEKALARTKASMAPFETALNIAGSVVSSGVLNSPSSSPSAFNPSGQTVDPTGDSNMRALMQFRVGRTA